MITRRFLSNAKLLIRPYVDGVGIFGAQGTEQQGRNMDCRVGHTSSGKQLLYEVNHCVSIPITSAVSP